MRNALILALVLPLLLASCTQTVNRDLGDTDGASDLDTMNETSLPDGLTMGDADVARDIPLDTTSDAMADVASDTIADTTSDMPIDMRPPDPPNQLTPCATADCWTSPTFGAACGTASLAEDFSSGNYNVHAFSIAVRAGIAVELTLTPTGGTWDPALLLHDAMGLTVYDGERGAIGMGVDVLPITSGRDGAPASVRFTSDIDQQMTVFLTTWAVVDSGFSARPGTGVSYAFDVLHDCMSMPGDLLSPPNFDPNNIDNGYYLLPESPNLYTRKADDCSRGNKLLIDVIYTVATQWNQIRPEYSPIAIRDMNEGSCSTVNHATHDDGTHVDIVASCGTSASCADIQPAVELAMLFVDTGEVCGIIFNDTAVQNIINPYFEANQSFPPWFGTFMRTVGNHVSHFHVRVKKPDGTCN